MISQEQEKKVDDYFISLFKDKDYLLTLDWDYLNGKDRENNDLLILTTKHPSLNIYLGLQIRIIGDERSYLYFLTKSPYSSLHLTFNEKIDVANIFQAIFDKTYGTFSETLCQETLKHLKDIEG